MAGWKQVEVDDDFSIDERASLRRQQDEISHTELINLYKDYIKTQYEVPEKISKKDRICMLLHTFGTKARTQVVAEAVDSSPSYVKRFHACDSITMSSSGNVTRHYDNEAHTRGEAPVVLQRESRRSNSLSANIRNAVLDRDGHECLRCGSTEKLQIHHIIPYSRGGKDEMQNLATLCYECHKDATLTRSASGEVPAYPLGEFEAWLDDNLDICAARTTNNTLCRNPAGSCPHHE
jgi:5-methylcytosine-specific restriction endonuclease McrA